MEAIDATAQCGIVVRRDALQREGVAYEVLLNVMEVDVPLDENQDLVSFGPSFGEEALHEFVRRLESLGLIHFSDFVAVSFDLPAWCAIQVKLGAPSG